MPQLMNMQRRFIAMDYHRVDHINHKIKSKIVDLAVLSALRALQNKIVSLNAENSESQKNTTKK